LERARIPNPRYQVLKKSDKPSILEDVSSKKFEIFDNVGDLLKDMEESMSKDICH